MPPERTYYYFLLLSLFSNFLYFLRSLRLYLHLFFLLFCCISCNIVVRPTLDQTLVSIDVVSVCESEVAASGCIH